MLPGLPPLRPIFPGGQAGIQDIVGRDGDITRLWNRLLAGSCLLNEPRRIGKTSLLKRASVGEKPPGWELIHSSVQGVRTSADLASHVLRDIRSQQSLPQRVRDSVLGFLSDAEVSVGTSGTGFALRGSFAQSPLIALEHALADVSERLADDEQYLVLAWDEFPDMIGSVIGAEGPDAAAALLGLLRRFREQHPERLRWLLTGSVGLHHALRRLGSSGGHYVNDLDAVPLGPLDRDWAAWLAGSLLLGAGAQFDLATMYAAADTTDGIPYLLHLVAGRARDTGPRTITAGEVDELFVAAVGDLDGGAPVDPPAVPARRLLRRADATCRGHSRRPRPRPAVAGRGGRGRRCRRGDGEGAPGPARPRPLPREIIRRDVCMAIRLAAAHLGPAAGLMTLARFTPSVLDPETLERLFVHRHDLLDDVLRRVEVAATSDARPHKLFVGPRGAGKTHLLSLVHHRVAAAGMRVGLSWLEEDPWEIETLDDLLAQIVAELDGDRPAGAPLDVLRQLVAEQGPVVVLAENLDQILAQIGDDGQRELRGLLENERLLLLIATTTRLSDDLLSQAQAFYGFFDVTTLEPFTVDEASDMLARIAEYSGDEALASVLTSPHGRARLATIEHLAGGQPRVWALLGTGLRSTGIDDMVDVLLARFDDLTPYYQEQLARLSRQEAKLVRRLADADRPLTVGALASLAGVDPKSAAKSISDLRKRGWVRQYKSILTERADARLRYYELAEPLARIAFQVKAARGRPIKLVLDFLATWFDADDLANDFASDAGVYRRTASATQTAYMRLAQLLTAGWQIRPLADLEAAGLVEVLESLDDAVVSWQRGDAEGLLSQPAPLSRLVTGLLSRKSAASLRIDFADLALQAGADARWRLRLDGSIDGLDPLTRACVAVLIAELELGARPQAGITKAAVAHAVARIEDLDGEGRQIVADLIAKSCARLPIAQATQFVRALDSIEWPPFARVCLNAVSIAALVAIGKTREAVHLARVAVDRELKHTPRHLGAASFAHSLLGELLGSEGSIAEALQQFDASLACAVIAYGPSSPVVRSIRKARAELPDDEPRFRRRRGARRS